MRGREGDLGVNQEKDRDRSFKEGKASQEKKRRHKSVVCLCVKKLVHVVGVLRARWHTNTGSDTEEAGPGLQTSSESK